MRDICQGLTRKDYRASIENKNNRLIVRGIEMVETSCEGSECGNIQPSQPAEYSFNPLPKHSSGGEGAAPPKIESSPGLKQELGEEDRRMSE